MMVELETFVEDLFEHIFIENNILFPQFEKLEREWVR
jgi:regulator of cell morphogenesis and NO signaling